MSLTFQSNPPALVTLTGTNSVSIDGTVSIDGSTIYVEVASGTTLPISGTVAISSGTLDANITNAQIEITTSSTSPPNFNIANEIDIGSVASGAEINVANQVSTSIDAANITLETNAAVSNTVLGTNPIQPLGTMTTASTTTGAGDTSGFNFNEGAAAMLCDEIWLAFCTSTNSINNYSVAINGVVYWPIPYFVRYFTEDMTVVSSHVHTGVYKLPITPYLLNGFLLHITNTTSGSLTDTFTVTAWGRYASRDVSGSVDATVSNATLEITTDSSSPPTISVADGQIIEVINSPGTTVSQSVASSDSSYTISMPAGNSSGNHITIDVPSDNPASFAISFGTYSSDLDIGVSAFTGDTTAQYYFASLGSTMQNNINPGDTSFLLGLAGNNSSSDALDVIVYITWYQAPLFGAYGLSDLEQVENVLVANTVLEGTVSWAELLKPATDSDIEIISVTANDLYTVTVSSSACVLKALYIVPTDASSGLRWGVASGLQLYVVSGLTMPANTNFAEGGLYLPDGTVDIFSSSSGDFVVSWAYYTPS